jgi:hypothetical protein
LKGKKGGGEKGGEGSKVEERRKEDGESWRKEGRPVNKKIGGMKMKERDTFSPPFLFLFLPPPTSQIPNDGSSR